MSVVKKYCNENSSVRRTRQKRLMLYQILLFAVRKNQGSLKIKKLVNYRAN